MPDQDTQDTVDKLSSELMAILVCPESKAKLIQVGQWLYSTDSATRRRYRINEGIPNLLIPESEVVEPDEFDRLMAEHKE